MTPKSDWDNAPTASIRKGACRGLCISIYKHRAAWYRALDCLEIQKDYRGVLLAITQNNMKPCIGPGSSPEFVCRRLRCATTLTWLAEETLTP